MTITRRAFMGAGIAAGAAGFTGLRALAMGSVPLKPSARINRYGELVLDPNRILDLPPDFSYRVLSRTGDQMSDGLLVPGDPDGMAAFAGPNGRVVLVRNHELQPGEPGPFGANDELLAKIDRSLLYDGEANPLMIGGTTTIVFDPATGTVERQFLSLAGTLRNCAGGPTPWGSWLSCEETEDRAGETGAGQDHGYVFEVPADAQGGLIKAVPLKAMGRFYHEAAAVDPRTGIIYMTEDREDGVLYRFIPNERGKLLAGGKLQALVVRDALAANMRNWADSGSVIERGARNGVTWIDLEDVEARSDHLRAEAAAKGAAIFPRGEGMWFGHGGVYFAATNGGRNKTGQIWHYRPSRFEGTAFEDLRGGSVELFIEPNEGSLLDMCDNITIAPWGDLVLAEDGTKDQYLRGVTEARNIYELARVALPGEPEKTKSELCGVCFSPNGATLFVNIQKPGITLAITGPWGRAAA